MAGPVRVHVRAGLVKRLVRVRAEEVALCLNQVRGQTLGAITVVERERGAKRGRGNAELHGGGHRQAPRVLTVSDSLVKEIIEKEINKRRILIERLLDLSEENAANNTSATPHQRNTPIVQLPAKLLRRMLEQHEPLRIRDDLRRIQRPTNVFNERLLSANQIGFGRGRFWEHLARTNAFFFQR